MRWRLIIATVALIPVVEIAVLVAVSRATGIGWALLATLVGSLLGGVVIRREGRRSMRRLREMLETGQTPGAESTGGVPRLVAGIALLAPGLVTDLVGLVLLLPPVQTLVRRWLRRSLERRLPPDAANRVFGPRHVRVQREDTAATGEVIEGEVVDTPGSDDVTR
jgi:UPF0716 protein FxsA